MDEAVCVVLTTAGDAAAAERLGQTLLKARLAACVQYDTVRSQYWWQGEICTDHEVRLVIKTLASRYAALEAMIVALHEYDCPQVVRLDATGSAGYVAWLRDVVDAGI